MQYHEIFRDTPEAARIAILAELFESEKEGYRAAVDALAPLAHVRTVFVMRMPPAKRHAWLAKHLSRKTGETIAGNVLQFWLAGPRKPMLVDFLDALGVDHEDGMIETLPESPPEGKLAPAVDAILEKYPADHVRIYLHVFREMDVAKWPELDGILASHPQLAGQTG